jgi:glycolate oxidase iron-sulfur subunit
MAVSEPITIHADGPKQVDLDKCVHCGLCLNACPTYRELGLEMDSPRGRVYQMVKVAAGEMQSSASYVEHIELCLACRGCETACPSGVPYGRMVEAARAEIERTVNRPWHVRLLRALVFRYLLSKPAALKATGTMLYLYEAAGLRRLIESSGVLKLFGKLGDVERLAPSAQAPFFFRNYGRTFPAEGQRRYRVALLAGCIANVCFARLNEATVRVLQKNGCDVVIPGNQNCCGALHVHAGWKDEARKLARNNIDACLEGNYDAILTNAAGCGSTLKEYHELLEDDPAYHEKARQFVARMKDVTEFLASLDLNPAMGPVIATATYQDSCHLAHGQRVRIPPRQLLSRVPELTFQEMPLSDVCCGSAGIYNVVQNEMSMQILEKKMGNVNLTSANLIVTANPGCMLQLEAGVTRHGRGQRVAHIVEVLDEAYRNYSH